MMAEIRNLEEPPFAPFPTTSLGRPLAALRTHCVSQVYHSRLLFDSCPCDEDAVLDHYYPLPTRITPENFESLEERDGHLSSLLGHQANNLALREFVRLLQWRRLRSKSRGDGIEVWEGGYADIGCGE